MAEEPKAIVTLSAGDPIQVALDPDQVMKKLTTAPFIKLTSVDGRTHWVTAAAIVSVQDPLPPGGAAVT